LKEVKHLDDTRLLGEFQFLVAHARSMLTEMGELIEQFGICKNCWFALISQVSNELYNTEQEERDDATRN